MAQARPHAPQCAGAARRSTSQPFEASRSQSAKPSPQVKPQATPLHVAVALGGVGQGPHDVPHEVIAVFATQRVSQA
jgi:hypothetical protein